MVVLLKHLKLLEISQPDNSYNMIPTNNDFKQTIERVRPYTHRTPILTSSLIDTFVGASLYFKCENFQKGGAYKLRGAINASLKLSQEQIQKGLVTHSSGNFAQAVSITAKMLGVPAYIVMPENSPVVKKNAVVGYRAEVTMCPSTLQDRENTTQAIIDKTQAHFLHPSNDLDVILGQGTVADELLEDYPDLDYIVSPVGGGGVIAGTCLAVNYHNSQCIVIGAEPFGADDAYHSLRTGVIQDNDTVNTIADGLRTKLGDQNFPIIKKYVQEIIRVEDEEIVNAMRLVWERMKIVIEPSSATTLAAIIREKEKFKGKKIGLIITGGNVDLRKLPF